MDAISKSGGSVLNVRIMFSYPDGTMVADSNNLVTFAYQNSINELPMGNFVINDTHNTVSNLYSGVSGVIIFMGTQEDDKNNKVSSIPFIITSVNRLASGNSTHYNISWIYGNHLTLQSKTFAVKGNSIDAIKGVAKQFESNFSDTVTLKSDAPTDVMTWRFIYDDYKSCLNKVISKSYIKNDNLIWYIDDVNDINIISSYNSEYINASTELFVKDINTNTDISNTVVNINKPLMRKWLYSSYIPSDVTGENLNKLYPIVNLSGTPDGEVIASNCNGNCFASTISANGDTTQSDIDTKINKPANTTYSPKTDAVNHYRYYPNNTHKMYALAPTFREYKDATHVKKISIVLKNVMGPHLGSVCSILCNNSTTESTGNTTYDTIYTGTYILVSRSIVYNAVKLQNLKKTNKGYIEFITTLEFMSNDINNKGYDAVLKLYKDVQVNA